MSTNVLPPRAVQRATRFLAAWTLASVVILYVAAAVTDPPASTNTGPPSLQNDSTLSAVLLRPPLRVAGGALLVVSLAGLAALEPLRGGGLPWPRRRAAAACLALVVWVALVLCTKPMPRNKCPPSLAAEETAQEARQVQMITHVALVPVFIASLALWVWLHGRASGRASLRRIALYLLASLLVMLGLVCVPMASVTLLHLLAVVEAVQLLLFVQAVWLSGDPMKIPIQTRQSAATPGPGAAAAPWSAP